MKLKDSGLEILRVEKLDASVLICLDTEDEYLEVKRNRGSLRQEILLNRYCKKIMSFSIDEEFLRKFFSRLNFIRNYGNWKMDGNKFLGYFKNEQCSIVMESELDSDKFSYSVTGPKHNISEECFKTGIGYTGYICCTEEHIEVWPNLKSGNISDEYDTYHVSTTKKLHQFDSLGIEIFGYNEEKSDDYYLNKETNEKILCEPDALENYTRRRSRWREGKYIIVRDTCNYVYPEDINSFISLKNTDVYLISKNFHPENRFIGYGAYYAGISASDYESYKMGECEIDEVYKKRCKSYMNETIL